MSARDSLTLNPNHFSSHESSPNSGQKLSDWEECQIDEESSQSTYLECENQQHYYEKYHEKTGWWPPETGWNPTDPPMLDEHSETEESAEEEQGTVSHSYLKMTTFNSAHYNTHRISVTLAVGPKLCLIHIEPVNDSVVSATHMENPTRRTYELQLLRSTRPKSLTRNTMRQLC
jgi:hypothetical protein